MDEVKLPRPILDPVQSSCDHCKNWGNTYLHDPLYFLVPCPKCGRKTLVNLGVNVPAGTSVTLGASRSIELIRLREQEICQEKLRQMGTTQFLYAFSRLMEKPLTKLEKLIEELKDEKWRRTGVDYSGWWAHN